MELLRGQEPPDSEDDIEEARSPLWDPVGRISVGSSVGIPKHPAFFYRGEAIVSVVRHGLPFPHGNGLMITLSSARELAAGNIQRAQRRYKEQYDRGTRSPDLRVGEWVFVRFPQDETGRFRKLSRPWHGPYRILERRDPDVTVTKVYHPQWGEIRVHQSQVCRCPDSFPAWYGGRCSGPGHPPKWVEKFLEMGHPSAQSHIDDSQEYEDPALEGNDDI